MRPALETDGGLPGADITFAIGEVAAMLGISPHTIRAWERRHLVVRPMRTTTGQRRYTSEDVELLRQIKHERHVHGLSMRVATLTAQGVVVPDVADPAPALAAPPGETAGDPLRMVADLVSEAVLVIDEEGRVVHANTAFVRFSGMLLGQLRGTPFADLVEPFDRAKAVQTYQAPVRQRRDWELRLRTAYREMFFSFDCWPVASGQGQVLVLVGRDLSARAPMAPEVDERRSGTEPEPSDAATGRDRGGVATHLHALLDGVADPVRTLGLVGPWLDDTPIGVVLTAAEAPLDVVFANHGFRRLAPDGRLPVALGTGAAGARLAAEAVEAIRAGRPGRISGLRLAGPGGEPVAWDVDLCPVTIVGAGVSHLVLVIADVTVEAASARRLDALVAFGPVIRQPSDSRHLLREAAPHARELLPNAGSLLALAGSGREAVDVVAVSGAWSRDGAGGGPDLRLALVRDAMRCHTSIEVERVGAEPGAVETFRIVPLPAPARRPREAPGALAFLRLGPRPFSADDRQLIDEFAGRLGLALARCLEERDGGPGALLW